MVKKKKGIKKRPQSDYSGSVKGRLLAIGMKHYVGEGSSGLSVRKVAEEANVNLGSFVYHFKSKEKFLEKIVLAHYSIFLEQFQSEFEKTHSMNTSTEKLEFILSRMSSIATSISPVVMRFLMDTLQGSTIVVKSFVKNPPVHLLILLKVIRQGQLSGEFRRDISARLLLFLCLINVVFPQVILTQIKSKLNIPILDPIFNEAINKQALITRTKFILKGLKSDKV